MRTLKSMRTLRPLQNSSRQPLIVLSRLSLRTYNPRKGSRRVCCDFAKCLLEDAQSVCDSLVDELDNEAQDLEDALPKGTEDCPKAEALGTKAVTYRDNSENLREVRDEVESVEFPGMFG